MQRIKTKVISQLTQCEVTEKTCNHTHTILWKLTGNSARKGNKVTKVSFNPLTPESDTHLIPPNSITANSNIKLMRINEIIMKSRNSCLSDKFSLSAL